MSKNSYKSNVEVEEGHQIFLKDIGEKIEKIRKEKDIPVTKLCDEVKMSRTTYYRMINGLIYFNTQKLLKILDVLNMNATIKFKKNPNQRRNLKSR